MTKPELIAALSPLLEGFGAELTDVQWQQYHLALVAVNPGDLDDAMADLRRTHAFRNAPLPAEILARCDAHRRSRVLDVPAIASTVKARAEEGEWRTFQMPGFPSLRLHVLPDDHPALPRYACYRCKDTSWETVPNLTDQPSQPTCRRCGCWSSNPVIAQQRTRDAEYRQRRTQ